MLVKQLIIISIILTIITSYKQFQLIRTQWKKYQKLICSNITSQSYQQICYQKDLSYSLNFYQNKQQLILSIDLTSPISWIKDQQCRILQNNNKCNKLHNTLKSKIISIGKKISKKFKKNKNNHKFTTIYGSNFMVMGKLINNKTLLFQSADSSRVSKFIDLLLLGFYLIGQKDQLLLKNTNFISATSIPQSYNNMFDGAISLRFDQKSQKSFLSQIFNMLDTNQKIITINLNNNNSTITIGDICLKYTWSGLSGIRWIQLSSDKHYGKLPKITSIKVQTLQQKIQQIQVNIKGIFTLSASYISFPQEKLNKLIKKLNQNCTISKNNYLQCSIKNKKFLKNKIIIQFNSISIGLNLSVLLLKQQHKKYIFNIKKSYNQYSILGQPVMKQYVVMFDYGKNKLGITQKRGQLTQPIVSLVTMMRFFMTTFIIGLCVACLQKPCRKVIRFFQIYPLQPMRNRNIKPQYTPIRQSVTDQLPKPI